MEWVVSTLHTTLEHGVSSITTADAHTPPSSSRLDSSILPKDKIRFLCVCHRISTGLFSFVSGHKLCISSWTESVRNYSYLWYWSLLPLQSGSLLSYALCPAFLPLLESQLKLSFWNCIEDSEQLFVNFRDFQEMLPSYYDFIPRNKRKSQGVK